jgi:hypothetical protein
MAGDASTERSYVMHLGPIDVDWLRSLGYFGGIAVAVALDLIAPELALFIAAVPLVKLLRRKDASTPERMVAAVIEGAAKPIGGDAQSTVRVAGSDARGSGDHPSKRLRRRVRREHA